MKKRPNIPNWLGALLLLGTLPLVQSSFTEKKTDDSPRYSVLFNNAPLSAPEILLDARGELAIEEQTSAQESRKIPFRVYLTRDDRVIYRAASDSLQTREGMVIRKVLEGAKKGDLLTVEPLQKNSEKGRRTIKVGGYTVFHWFPIPRTLGDGC